MIVKDIHNLQHSSWQNENFYSCTVYIFEKENKFPFQQWYHKKLN